MLRQQVCGAGHDPTVAPGIRPSAPSTCRREHLHERPGPDGRTMRRTGLDPWEDAGLGLSGVRATDTALIGLDTATGTFVELSPS